MTKKLPLSRQIAEANFGFKKIEEIIHIYEEKQVTTEKDFNQRTPKLLI